MAPTKKLIEEEAVALLREGITMTLSWWSVLQLAVKNEWGGPRSRGLVEDLASGILSWFTKTSHELQIDDLEEIIEVALCDDLNTVIGDHNNVAEVAQKLMIMHGECLEGNYQSILNLRPQTSKTDSQKAVNDDGFSNVTIHVPKPQSKSLSYNSNSGVARADTDGSLKVLQRKKKRTRSCLKIWRGKGVVGADADGWLVVWDRTGANTGSSSEVSARDGQLKVCTQKNSKK